MAKRKKPIEPTRLTFDLCLNDDFTDELDGMKLTDIPTIFKRVLAGQTEEVRANAYLSFRSRWDEMGCELRSSEIETPEAFQQRLDQYKIDLTNYYGCLEADFKKKREALDADEAEFERLRIKLGK